MSMTGIIVNYYSGFTSMKGYGMVNKICTWFVWLLLLLSFLFLFLLVFDKDLPCIEVPLCFPKKGIKPYVQRLLLSRSLQRDSKYLKELECSWFFHNHLFRGNCQLLIYQHDFLVTWQNWGIIFLAALDFHIPGPSWWKARNNCHPKK